MQDIDRARLASFIILLEISRDDLLTFNSKKG